MSDEWVSDKGRQWSDSGPIKTTAEIRKLRILLFFFYGASSLETTYFMSSLWSEDRAIRLQWLRPFSGRRIIFSVVNILLPPSSLAGVICQVGQVLRLHYCTELHRALHCSSSVATGIATTLLSRSFLSTDCFCCKVIPHKNKNSIERTQSLLRE